MHHMCMLINRTTLVLLALLVQTAGLAAVEIRNELIRFETDIVGNFKLWTTGGNPASDNDNDQDLLNNANFGTSYVLVSVDGVAARFGSSAGKNLVFAKLAGKDLVASWEFRGVVFEQQLSLYRSIYSSQSNLMRVFLKVKNGAAQNRRVGIRFVFDTVAGPLDTLGFCLPGTGLLTRGKKVTDPVPSHLFVCDRPVKSNANLEFNFYGAGLVTPDELFISHERYAGQDTALVPALDNSFNDDYTGKSSVMMLWKEKTFAPGATDGVAVAAGIATQKAREGSPLNLMLSVPETTGGSRENFWIGAVLENENKFWDITKIAAIVQFDPAILALSGSTETSEIDRIDRAGKGFCSWCFKVLKDGETEISLRINAIYRSMPIRMEYKQRIRVGKG